VDEVSESELPPEVDHDDALRFDWTYHLFSEIRREGATFDQAVAATREYFDEDDLPDDATLRAWLEAFPKYVAWKQEQENA